MKLLTKELLVKFAKQGDCSQKSSKDIKIIAKFFNPCGAQTWYASEYIPEDDVFFGFVDLGDPVCAELGYFSRAELESIVIKPYGLHIERDRSFEAGVFTLQDVIDGKRP